MTEQIDSIRAAKPMAGQQQEEIIRHRQREKTSAALQDRISLGYSVSSGETYGPGLQSASPYDLLRNLVIKTLQDQGVNLTISRGDVDIDLNTIAPEEAQALIAEDGYFGVEKTADRIVDFAINAFGNDPAKLEQMKAAIDQGFQDAQDVFGGTLPEISQQTYETVIEKLGAFAARFENSGE